MSGQQGAETEEREWCVCVCVRVCVASGVKRAATLCGGDSECGHSRTHRTNSRTTCTPAHCLALLSYGPVDGHWFVRATSDTDVPRVAYHVPIHHHEKAQNGRAAEAKGGVLNCRVVFRVLDDVTTQQSNGLLSLSSVQRPFIQNREHNTS